MKLRSLIFNMKSNTTAAFGLFLLATMTVLKETGATTLITGLILNGQDKGEALL